MISLLQLVNEAKQVGTLYHSTNADNLISILKSNVLKKNQSDAAMQFTDKISFTRDKNYRPGEYTIEIDGNKLSNNYKTTPFAYYQGEREESEEVVDRDIENIKKYITNIYANID